MSASFQEHLELALGDEYRVERELGGGGMSRVFLATEVALGRKVVIKVLTPELAAGVNRERFRREVQLAATLQHPLIVPVLSAGEAEGLLWYTMPFVEGESLRERLHRGVMSSRDALPLLVDVARALGAAHRKGVVHRDIKPGNILLHEQHAVVADFGVAKALTAATADSTGLTTSGLAVGTPAYMSPEQAAGDNEVDARSDIYALGCVAYEILSGKTPFVDPSAARLLVAHVSQTPVPLQQLANVRPGIARVIMRCLEKDPANRWQTADALADALDAERYSGEPTPIPAPRVVEPEPTPRAAVPAVAGTARRGRKLWMIGGVVAAVVAAAVFLSGGGTRRGRPRHANAFTAPKLVLVADVENRTADSTLGDLLSEALRTELRESKFISVLTPTATNAALQRMQRPVVPRIDGALAREIAVREGVPVVVEGRIQKVGNTFLVRAALVSPADGAEQSAEQETAATEDDLIAAIGRLARRTRQRLGESGASLTALAPMERVTTGSIDALRKYTAAIRIGDSPAGQTDGQREIDLLEEAVKLDSTFAMAWRRLGVRLASGGGFAFSFERRRRGIAALTRAYELREKLAPVERGLAEAAYFSFVTNEPDKAAAAYTRILDEQPANRIALNNLASSALTTGEFTKVREYGSRYVAVDSSNIQAWLWLWWGAYGTGDVAEARRLREVAARRFTSPAEVKPLNEMMLMFLSVERDWGAVETLARKMLAETTSPQKVDEYTPRLTAALLARGKLNEALRVTGALGAARLASRDTAEQRRWRGDSAHEDIVTRAWYAGDTVGIQDGIRKFIAESRVDTWAMAERPSANLVFDYIVAGDPKQARARFAAYRAEAVRQAGKGAMISPDDPGMQALEAQVLIAEGRPTDALRMLEPLKADAVRMPSPQSYWIGRAFADAGQLDSARVWLARLVDSEDPRRTWSEGLYRIPTLRLLCELAETTEQKRRSCGTLATEWKDADQRLQPVVARAKARLAEEPGSQRVRVKT